MFPPHELPEHGEYAAEHARILFAPGDERGNHCGRMWRRYSRRVDAREIRMLGVHGVFAVDGTFPII